MSLTDRERNVLILLDKQECSAGDGAEQMLESLEARGLLKARSQTFLDARAKVGEARVMVKRFYRTTKKGRAALRVTTSST